MEVYSSSKSMDDSGLPQNKLSKTDEHLKHVQLAVDSAHVLPSNGRSQVQGSFSRTQLTADAGEKLANLTLKKAHFKYEASELKATLRTTSSEYLKLVTSQKRDDLALELQELKKEIKLAKKDLENHSDELSTLKLLRENLIEEKKHSTALGDAYMQSIDEEIAKIDMQIAQYQQK